MIRRKEGETFTKYLLMQEIVTMSELIGAELSKEQMKFIVNYILESYWYFTISDITALTAQSVRVKPYGKPMLQNIIIAIDNWDVQRQDYAVNHRSKESSKLKADTITDGKMEEIYAKMKADKPKPTQKEKDKINQEELKQKLEELQRMYPKK